jgi:hypothetical protein
MRSRPASGQRPEYSAMRGGRSGAATSSFSRSAERTSSAVTGDLSARASTSRNTFPVKNPFSKASSVAGEP